MRGTDTALAFDGEREWQAAGLVALGIPTNEAINMIEQFSTNPRLIVRVCASCVAKSEAFKSIAPALIFTGGNLPSIRQP
jgi:hypothetical protein